MQTSPTSIDMFLRCEHAWYTRAISKVERRGDQGQRVRGDFFHRMLEYTLREYDATGEVFAFAGQDGWDVGQVLAANMYRERSTGLPEEEARECLDAIRWQIPRLALHEWEVVRLNDGRPAIECDLVAPDWPAEGHTITTKLDVCLRNKASGNVWHFDFKSSKKNLVRPNSVDRKYQLLLGRELLARYDVKVDGSALCYLRSVAPTPPRVVHAGKKNESLSLAAEQPCDWSTYETAVRARHEDPDDPRYAGMREKLADNVFQKWSPDTTSREAERAMLEQLVSILNRMDDLASGRATPIRSFQFDCGGSPNRRGCDFNEWCSAGLGKPGGVDLVQIGTTYRAREGSPYIHVPISDSNPNASYLAFARQHGHVDLEPHMEFRPQ